jgi:hypothetical protein
MKKEVTLGAGKANLLGVIFFVPIILFILIPYYYLWPGQFSEESIRSYLVARDLLSFSDIAIGITIVLVGIVSHELLHGIGWSIYAKEGWKSIKFGVTWKFLTPYCHCKEPLLIKFYRFGTALPAIIIGIIPSFISLLSGNIWLMLFGLFFTFAAGGDFLILWLLSKENSSALIQDHPDKIGCIIFNYK